MSQEIAGLLDLDRALVDSGAAQELNVELVAISGADAASFLQGQLSADVASLVPSGSCWSLLLEPEGRLGELLRIQRHEDERFSLLGAAGRAASIAARLDRFRFRVDVTLELRQAGVSIGTGPTRGVPLAAWLPGVDEVLMAEPVASPRGDGRQLDALGLLRGRLGPADVAEGMNPFELGASLIEAAVSFTKGCYTGQELVARIDARTGTAPHRLWWLCSDERVEPGPVEVEGEVLGDVLRSVCDPSASSSWGSARVTRKLEPSGPVACRVDGVAAEIRPF